MKRFTFAALALFLVAFPKPLPAQQPHHPQSSVELQYTRTVAVSGRGEVSAKPDHATVRLGAQVDAETAAEAQSGVNEIMNKVLAQIKELGISERSIRTSSLNLHPIYQQRPRGNNGEAEISGYSASNTVQVSLDNLDLIGKVIDAGMAAGVNRLEGVSFELRNDQSQRNDALILAIGEARAKAAAMAPALGVKLGPLREVVEGGVSIDPPQPFLGRRAAFMSTEMATPIQPGEVRLEASVTLRYDIIPE